MKAILITPNGKVSRVAPKTLSELQNIVGGYVQVISLPKCEHEMYVNEDGIALGLPYNSIASKLCIDMETGLAPMDFIKGNAVVVGPVDSEGYDTDIAENLAQHLLSLAY